MTFYIELPVPEYINHLDLILCSVFSSDDIVWLKCLQVSRLLPRTYYSKMSAISGPCQIVSK